MKPELKNNIEIVKNSYMKFTLIILSFLTILDLLNVFIFNSIKIDTFYILFLIDIILTIIIVPGAKLNKMYSPFFGIIFSITILMRINRPMYFLNIILGIYFLFSSLLFIKQLVKLYKDYRNDRNQKIKFKKEYSKMLIDWGSVLIVIFGFSLIFMGKFNINIFSLLLHFAVSGAKKEKIYSGVLGIIFSIIYIITFNYINILIGTYFLSYSISYLILFHKFK